MFVLKKCTIASEICEAFVATNETVIQKHTEVAERFKLSPVLGKGGAGGKAPRRREVPSKL
jgi:hypothetical protein